MWSRWNWHATLIDRAVTPLKAMLSRHEHGGLNRDYQAKSKKKSETEEAEETACVKALNKERIWGGEDKLTEECGLD